MRTCSSPASWRRAAVAAIVLCASSAALAESSSASPPQAAQPTEWKQWNGRYYRLEADGHLSCYNNGSRRSDCTASFPDPAKQKPLSCNSLSWRDDDGRKVTGYEKPGHWCNTAYANLFAEWKSYKPLGFDMQLATTPRGDVMCRSADGTTCSPSDAPVATAQIDPLVCGKIYKRRTGGSSTGYDDSAHWCRSLELLVHSADPLAYKSVVRGSAARLSLPVDHLNLTDRPAWIVRFQTPEAPSGTRFFGNILTFRLLDADPTRWLPDERRQDVRHMTSIQLRSSRGSANYIANAPFADVHVSRDVHFDARHRGTLAIRMNPDGSSTFYQAAGWPDDILTDAFALKAANGAVLDEAGADLPPWPVHRSVLEIKAMEGNTWQDLGPEAGYVKELLVVRKRPGPAR